MLKKTFTIAVFLWLSCTCFLSAQVTTASIQGNITDNSGEPLIGATVVATHVPSGSKYGTTTREDGGFTLPNLRIGGPYSIECTYVGYETQTASDIQLVLGQKLDLDFTLKEASTTIDQVVVSAEAGSVFNRDRTGPTTTINSDQIRTLPTINRSAADFYRLTPSAQGGSFGGRNDQYNNFSLDGSIFNNPFGLDAATPGGQTDAQPIPLDAIEQIHVAVAPFDITQAGFTGAGINTVTKSGTNEFKGTIYGFFRNEDLTGGKVSGQEIFVPDLTQYQTGISLGGPIIKNKLFYFATFELERRDDLGSSFLAARSGVTGENVSRVEAADLDAVSAALFDRFQYVTGPYENYVHSTDNSKGIIKFDYNINQNHTITAKYNFLDASKEKPAHPSAIGRRGPDLTTLQFRNSGYQINNKIHSGIIEWKALFSNNISNKMLAGYTAFRDTRDPFSVPFPVININKDGIRYIVAGHEPFSINNKLDQDVFQFTDNLNIYAGDHTITVGTSFERFDFDNSFNLGVYDSMTNNGGTFGPGFVSAQAFVDSVNTGAFDDEVAFAKSVYETNTETENNGEVGWALAETNVGQWAVYAQDEWSATKKLTLTLGLRVDMPLYFNTSEKIQENIDRQCCYDPTITWYDEDGNPQMFDNTVLPDNTPLFSPRFGFNYDIKGDKTMQFRGGTGMFTGRFPFVWIGNHVANPNFYFYNYTRTDFKFPQVWKTNLGYDHKFNGGWLLTVDLLYSKDINSMMVRNYGLKPPTGRLGGVDNRLIYKNDTDRVLVFGAPTNGYIFTNSDQGYAFNGSVQVSKDWGKDFVTMIAYNYNESKDVSSIEAEISSDAYDRNPAFGHVNDDVLAHSIYGNRHRILGTIYKRWSYGNGKYGTSVSAFFEYVEGGRFSYTYSGDINNDGSGLNDLIFIPTDDQLNQMTFSGSADYTPDEMRNAFKVFIEQDEYLSGRRGDYAEKYGILTPWYSTWDIRILQDFNLSIQDKQSTVQISIDILNAGNLLSSDWGVRQFPTNSQPVSVSVDGSGNPVYGFDPALTKTFSDDFGLVSRWQMQFGLRFIF